MLKPHFILNMSEVKRGLNFLEKGGDFADGVIAYHVQDYHNACLLTFDKKAQKLAQQLNLTCIEPNWKFDSRERVLTIPFPTIQKVQYAPFFVYGSKIIEKICKNCYIIRLFTSITYS